MGDDMLDYEALVSAGARLCSHDQKNAAVLIATNGLNARYELAVRVEREFAEFEPVVKLMEHTLGAVAETDVVGDGLMREYEAIRAFVQKDSPLLKSMDYCALLAGMSGFMERFEAPDLNTARVVLRAMEKSPTHLDSSSGAALTLMALWFSNYRGFRAEVVGDRWGGLDLEELLHVHVE